MNTIENIIRKITVSYVHAHSISLYTKHKHPYILTFSISIITLTIEKKIISFNNSNLYYIKSSKFPRIAYTRKRETITCLNQKSECKFN